MTGAAASGGTIALLLESDGPGGAEVMVLSLAVGLRERGYRPLVVLPITGCGWLAARCAERGIASTTFTHRYAVDPACLWGLARLIREQGVDLVHSHESTLSVYGAGAAALTGKPHLSTIHGQTPFLRLRRNRVALRWALRRSASRVTVSSATARWLAAELGAKTEWFDVIPNGVEERAGNRRAGRAALDLGDGELLLLAVGNLYPVKGHRVLLEALGRLAGTLRQGPGWRLAIAGEGDEREPLTARSRTLGIAERVSLLGHRSDIPDLLAAADVFVMPSLSEGTPLSLLEAMVAGKPIIATRVGGIPDVLGEGGSGVIVAPGDVDAMSDALAALLASSDERARLGQAAEERGRRFYLVDSMVERYVERYLAALNPGRPGPPRGPEPGG